MPYDKKKSSYRQELEYRKKELIKQIKQLEKEVLNPPNKITDEWMKEYEQLNLLKVNLMTVKNHLTHLSINHSGLIEVTFNNSLFKNNRQ
ncbi:MAG: hypothetical protein N4A35_05280 [Flavobacteriales bacterium]|jgi:hypothetical protein|nr:hypothetical protein [Flavobacteriales bacterium]